jgi:hypothetical protein
MKKITFISILSMLSVVIGSILMVGGNHIGDYMVAAGAVIGMYSMYLLDMESAKNPENRV